MPKDSYQIEKLNGDNFHLWKFKMEMIFKNKDAWGIVTGTEKMPPDTAPAERADYCRREQKAQSALCLSIDDALLHLVRTEKTVIQMWKRLCDNFEKKSPNNCLYLRRKLYRLNMEEGSDPQIHINLITTLADKILAIASSDEDKLSETEKVAILLGSLPDSFSFLVTTLDSAPQRVDWNTAVSRVMDFYQKQKESGRVSDDSKALFHGKGKSPQRPPDNSQRKPPKKTFKKCTICKKMGHLAPDCWFNSANRGKNPNCSSGQANVTQQQHDQGESFDYGFFTNESESSKTDLNWYIDSGATQHMCFQENWFVGLSKFKEPEKIYFGDNRFVEAVGVGQIRAIFSVNSKAYTSTMSNVLFVPKLAKNLFSVGAVVNAKKTVTFGTFGCKILNQANEVVAEGVKKGKLGKLYQLLCKVLPPDSNANSHTAMISGPAPLNLWHQRLGHPAPSTAQAMIKDNLATGMRQSASDSKCEQPCEGCVLGKMARQPFPKESATRAVGILDLIHSDIWGPMKTASLKGAKYFLSFIDDFSRVVFVYFLRYKSEAYEKFKEFEALVTNMTGKTIKMIRTDNGGEFTSKNFESFLKAKGIHHQLTVPYTPQQNGVAERMNRTLVESARCMIKHAKLSDSFWAEAVNTAAYLRNRIPSTACKNRSPYELWHGKKPDLKHLRVFGCLAYSHIPENLRSKFDSKAVKCRFLGYSTQSKAYRVFDIEKKIVSVTRNIICDETTFDNCATNPASEMRFVQHFDDNIVRDDTDQPDLDGSFNSTAGMDGSKDGSPHSDTMPGRVTTRAAAQRLLEPLPELQLSESSDEAESNFANLNFCLFTDAPETFKEAMKAQDSARWKEAMDAEMNSLLQNDTWELVELPQGRKSIGSRWVLRIKLTADQRPERYKARVVAKGYSQQPGIDFQETFAPVIRYDSIRLIFALAVQFGLTIHVMDAVTAFLNGVLQETIYMQQPEGYAKPGQENLVCKLRKSIYGLKQAPRCWNRALLEVLLNDGFVQATADQCIFLKKVQGDFVVIALYVDDLLIASQNLSLITACKRYLSSKFSMKDLGEIQTLLGSAIFYDQKQKLLRVSQQGYIESMLKKFNLEDAKPVSVPLDPNHHLTENAGQATTAAKLHYQMIIGGLLYAATVSRPDIAATVNKLSRFLHNPSNEHWKAAKHVLRYLKGTAHMALNFSAGKTPSLIGYSDADWAGDVNNRKSTSGYVFKFGNSVITWSSKQQRTIALSSCEAEYIAVSSACQEALWLQKLLNDVGVPQNNPVTIFEDNQGAIKLSKAQRDHSRTKHIDIRHHFIRQLVEDGQIHLEYCPTDQMIADILTKPLPRQKFELFRELCNVK